MHGLRKRISEQMVISITMRVELEIHILESLVKEVLRLVDKFFVSVLHVLMINRNEDNATNSFPVTGKREPPGIERAASLSGNGKS